MSESDHGQLVARQPPRPSQSEASHGRKRSDAEEHRQGPRPTTSQPTPHNAPEGRLGHAHENMIHKPRPINASNKGRIQSVTAMQPMATPPMKVDSRNGGNLPHDANGHREWSYELMNYENPGAIAQTVVCPCIVYARNNRRWDHLDRHDAPHPNPASDDGPQCIGHACATLLCFSCALNMCGRKKIRDRYHIQGNAGSDCVESFALYPCSLLQESREIALEESVLREQGVDYSEFYTYERAPGGWNPFVPSSGAGGNGCSCFTCCMFC
jgi:Cys-rich protein (TIGR01571 family)